MPPPKHRKKPFSAKQKKEQLKTKRDKKRDQGVQDGYGQRAAQKHAALGGDSSDDNQNSEEASNSDLKKVNEQPQQSRKNEGYDPNKYRLHFMRDTPRELERRKKQATEPLETLPETSLEVDIDEIYRPGSVLDMPKRPKWEYKSNKQALEAKEEEYFKNYLDDIMEKHSGDKKSDQLSYFEVNLETWRQLWRVLERADLLLLITDIRHPALHFSPAFYNYVINELEKPLILVLNKIDLAPPSLVVAWQQYFLKKFPKIHVICFTSFPRDSSEAQDPEKVLIKKKRRKAFSAVGPKQLLDACEKIVQGKVNLSSWRDRIEEQIAGVDSEEPEIRIQTEEVQDYSNTPSERYKDGILTIGCCGYTNVGKSSLMNGLMGKKVVSVSKTPGHTKHFQTIFLTPTVMLCDSPGLVFPSLVPKPMQILAGIYPIAQVREPYTAVGYLAQRLPLVKQLALKHPEADDYPPEKILQWSALDICYAWAEKRGFLTAKAGRSDVYRAANHLLRLAVQGRLCMCTVPPGYTAQKDFWEQHEDTATISSAQCLHCGTKHGETVDIDIDFDIPSTETSSREQSDEEEEASNAKTETCKTSNPFSLLGEED